MFNPLYNSQLFEKNIYNQSSHYKNYGQFLLWMEATANWLWTKINGTTKEGTGISMKNTLYVQQYGKGTSRAEATLNNKKIKPVA